MVKEESPSQAYIKNISYINFTKGSVALTWDKKKGKPKYDKGNTILWLGPYIIMKMLEKETYYVSAMDGRRMPLPVDGSLLQLYIKET
jgi:hypothetical protein